MNTSGGCFLPILKLLVSEAEAVQMNSKLVKIYFISAFLVLVSIFVFIFGDHKLSFYISTVVEKI